METTPALERELDELDEARGTGIALNHHNDVVFAL